MNDQVSETLLSYLIFKDLPSELPWESINAYLTETWSDQYKVENIETSDNSLVFSYMDYRIATVIRMDAPYPQEELTDRCDSTWWWPEALTSIKEQNSHMILALTGGEGTALEKHTHLTALVCAISSATSPLAVMWNGVVLQEPKSFRELAEESQAVEPPIPLSLWVDFQVYQPEEGRFNIFSWGLEPLGIPDMEVHGSTDDPSETLEMVQMVALYCLENDVIFEDGETFGFDEEHRIPVRYAASAVDPSKEVLILDVE